MLVGLIAGILLLMWLAPGLPLSRTLHKHLVELPLAWLDRLERHHLIFVVIVCALMSSSALGGALLGSAELVFAFALDASLYVDAVIATSAVAAMSNLKAAAARLRSRLGGALRLVPHRRPKLRSKRARTRRAPKLPANDGEGGVYQLAA